MAEVKITKENFDAEVRNYKGKVLLDFWADWCGPCNMLSPIIEEIADELDGQVKVGKVNVDDEPFPCSLLLRTELSGHSLSDLNPRIWSSRC